ncbi:InlB B-repeat-containing protein [Lachnospiraceae bacterium LCP25S3_G4]
MEYYIFEGWFQDAAYTIPVTKIEPDTTSDLTLYAKWKHAIKYSVKIPKTVVLDGKTGKGEYVIGVKGSIPEEKTLEVKPSGMKIQLEEQKASLDKKQDVIAKITQNKMKWSVRDLQIDTWSKEKGTIMTDHLSAGNWKGSVSFNVSIGN